MSKEYYTYIMSNSRNTVLYTGVTSGLMQRVNDHKAGIGSAFTKKYNVTKLVYYEFTNEASLPLHVKSKSKAGHANEKKI